MNQPTAHFGFIYLLIRFFLKPWTSRVRMLNVDIEWLKQLEKERQLLLVGHIVSFIDLLVVNDFLLRSNLRPVTATHGFNPLMILPFNKGFKRWFQLLFSGGRARQDIEFDQLFADLREGQNAYLFLKRAPKRFGTKVYYYHDMFDRLTKELPERADQVILIPTSLFLTRQRKGNTRLTLVEVFFGTYDFPGRLRKFFQLLVNNRKGGIVFSKPIDLGDELRQLSDLDRHRIEKRLRWTLLFHLNNEDRAYRGPTKYSVERKVRKILKERRLIDELKKVAERQNRPLEPVIKEATKELRHIASDTSARTINLLRLLFDYVWSRTIEHIDVHDSDLERVRELNKKGPVLLLPCHRSHVDYLVFAYTFEVKGLNNPRFAAGENLSKWPLGSIFRRAGAFFIRRSFKGETIFPLVFEAYLRHLIRERNNIVFFMEGGRSRTGKLLHPKIGMMAMVFDTWRQGIVEDMPLVPVTIDYGKVFEGESYLMEKSGGEKRQENLLSVIKSSKLLKRKHGVIRMRFGQEIYLSQYAAARNQSRESLGFKNRIPFLHELSHHVMGKINDMVTLTAGNIIASLLLGNPRRGMTTRDLKALFLFAVRFLRRRKVELAFAEQTLDLAMENALRTFETWETIVRVEVGGEVVIHVPSEKRPEMEYYKNNGLHFVLDVALFSFAFKCLDPQDRDIPRITEFACELMELLQLEFIQKENFPNESAMEKAYKALAHVEGLQMRDDKVVWGNYKVGCDMVHICGHLLLNFVESYFAVAEVLTASTPTDELDRKKLLKSCIQKAKLLHAVGTLRREESVNNLTFSNALDHFQKRGWIQSKVAKGQKNPNILVNEKHLPEFQACKEKIFAWINALR